MRPTTIRLVATAVLITTTTACLIPVTDFAVIGKNAAIVTERTKALYQQREATALIRRMGRSLDIFAALARYRMPDPPRMRTRWPEGLIPQARQFVDVLNGGDSSGAGYAAITIPLVVMSQDLSTIPNATESMKDTIRRRLATLQTVDVLISTSADLNGRVRGARTPYRQALAVYEGVVTVAGTTNQVAGQLAAGVWLKAQQDHVHAQLAIEINRQAIVQNLMEREASVGALLYVLGALDAATHTTERPRIDSPVDWVIH